MGRDSSTGSACIGTDPWEQSALASRMARAVLAADRPIEVGAEASPSPGARGSSEPPRRLDAYPKRSRVALEPAPGGFDPGCSAAGFRGIAAAAGGPGTAHLHHVRRIHAHWRSVRCGAAHWVHHVWWTFPCAVAPPDIGAEAPVQPHCRRWECDFSGDPGIIGTGNVIHGERSLDLMNRVRRGLAARRGPGPAAKGGGS